MAAEFSRELSVKEFRGKSRLTRLGFWVGGTPAYGYRRLLVSADGTPKQILNRGEQKNLKTDRVILVPGPQQEIECIRSIFSLALEGESCRSIAAILNRRGITHFGQRWLKSAVYKILKNPTYTGANTWNRTSTRMRSKRKTISRQEWVTKPGAFSALVDQQTFERTQLMLPRRLARLRSDKAILRKVRRVFKAKGKLSYTILQNARGTPSVTSIHKRFGGYRRLFAKVGYHLPAPLDLRIERLIQSIRLRRELIEEIQALFPKNVVISRLPPAKRRVLLVDGQFVVSVLLCFPCRRRGRYFWVVEPTASENRHITLLCPIKRTRTQVLGYFVFPRLDGFKSHCMFRNDPFLSAAVRLRDLSEFYAIVKRVWEDIRESLYT